MAIHIIETNAKIVNSVFVVAVFIVFLIMTASFLPGTGFMVENERLCQDIRRLMSLYVLVEK